MNVDGGSSTPGQQAAERLMSLDALRGADMFLLVGLGAIFQALPKAWEYPFLQVLANQCQHPQWHGFTLWDLIFPLFIFIVGAAMPFSLTRRAQRDGKAAVYRHVFLRAVLLFLLGLVYWAAPGGVNPTWGYYSVLYRIGFSYLLAALIMLNFRPLGQLLWAAGILLGYYLAMRFVPVPGYGAGNFSPEGALSTYIANWVAETISPNFQHVLSITLLPSAANALLGALAGQWLQSANRPARKVLCLLLVGGLLIASSFVVHQSFPINKKLLSTSFSLLASGISMVLLGTFYLVVDVWKLRKWAFFFVVVGMNPIAIYLGSRYFDFPKLAEVFVGALATPQTFFAYSVAIAVVAAALKWLFLYFLYRKKIFIRV